MFLLALLSGLGLVFGDSSQPPHVLLVLADDLGSRPSSAHSHIRTSRPLSAGWGNLGNRAGAGANQSTIPAEANTPNIDGLTKAGIRLNRHYT
jgi:arylsulfatase A-like enzyme